jgi:hypothetical protein
MPPKIVVFLGPSLPVDQAKAILDADYRPPAKRGDILNAAKEGVSILGLIDGVFFQECSVAHKEILYALQKGVTVVGASSMGALRASEMMVYGMEGVGEIFQLYRQGTLESDDEVALIFDPVNLEPLSEPLVNIRHNLRIALDLGFIDQRSREMLLETARSLYFPKRSYEKILDLAKGKVPEETLAAFERFIRTQKADLKKEDAQKALVRIKEISSRLSQ